MYNFFGCPMPRSVAPEAKPVDQPLGGGGRARAGEPSAQHGITGAREIGGDQEGQQGEPDPQQVAATGYAAKTAGATLGTGARAIDHAAARYRIARPLIRLSAAPP